MQTQLPRVDRIVLEPDNQELFRIEMLHPLLDVQGVHADAQATPPR